MDGPSPERYRLWSARRCAITLAISLVVFGGGTATLGSLIRLHPVGPAERIDAADGRLLQPAGRRDWSQVAGAPIAAQWDADRDGRADQRWPLEAAGDGRWRLPAGAAPPADAELRLRYPAISLWRMLLAEFLR